MKVTTEDDIRVGLERLLTSLAFEGGASSSRGMGSASSYVLSPLRTGLQPESLPGTRAGSRYMSEGEEHMLTPV